MADDRKTQLIYRSADTLANALLDEAQLIAKEDELIDRQFARKRGSF